ncbi:MAG TPA: hypothetical protein PLH80_09615 [Spirochaetota bacterium]|nr:hypothetical protein [Spirochaetota bacterium]HOR94070.1 hypothetical protein [Spirochaetota bacterium]HOT19043.1 hypothetical protein [Spirochaetota bacterium]HPD04676.1 hypothetical protein [Spirochaetota bacterium]HQG41283.1 hypothetical protein [Spirochaetota bacterium]
MVVLYIAVISVIVGVIVVLYSEFFEHTIMSNIPHDRYVPNLDVEMSSHSMHNGKEQYHKTMDSDDIPDIDIDFDSIPEDETTIDTTPARSNPKSEVISIDEQSQQNNNKNDDVDVVMYVDSSGTIGDIGSGMRSENWSSLTRIGAGTLRYKQQGINIAINNKLYRYDFYRINNLKVYDNYMLFTLKGKQGVNCLLLNNESDILSFIENEYKQFVESHKQDG